jgi:hypothetical protein
MRKVPWATGHSATWLVLAAALWGPATGGPAGGPGAA